MTQAELIQATPNEINSLPSKPIVSVNGNLCRYVRSTTKRHGLIRLNDNKVVWVSRV